MNHYTQKTSILLAILTILFVLPASTHLYVHGDSNPTNYRVETLYVRVDARTDSLYTRIILLYDNSASNDNGMMIIDGRTVKELDTAYWIPEEIRSAIQSLVDVHDDNSIVVIHKVGEELIIEVKIVRLLNYISSDPSLYADYMNYAINTTSPNECLDYYGITGFNLYMLVPRELGSLLAENNVPIANVRFEIYSGLLNESTLLDIADNIKSNTRIETFVENGELSIEARDAPSHLLLCMFYDKYFWQVYGVPRTVALIPLLPGIESLGSEGLLQLEIGRVPVYNVSFSYRIPSGLELVTHGGIIVNNTWHATMMDPLSNRLYISYNNRTITITQIGDGITYELAPQINFKSVRTGIIDLGNVSVTYCVDKINVCSTADVPVYSASTMNQFLMVEEENTGCCPENGLTIEPLAVIVALLLVIVASLYMLKLYLSG